MSDEHPEVDLVEMMHGITGIAAVTAQMFRSLVSEGFSRKEAMQLTSDWLVETLKSGKAT